MTVLCAGNEICHVIRSSTSVVESTITGTFDSADVRSSIAVPYLNWAELPEFAAIDDLWVHWHSSAGNSYDSGYAPMLELYAGATPVFRIQVAAENQLRLQYWDGDSWENVGAAFAVSTARVTFDLHLNATGAELYLGGEETVAVTIAMPLVVNITKARWCASDSTTAQPAKVSQMIVADESTIDWKFTCNPPTGDGANSAWTGTYADVDELATSDADLISGAANGDTETFTRAARTISGTVKAVVLASRGRNAATGAQNMQHCYRQGGSDYFTSNLAGIGTGYAPLVSIMHTNPATGSAWTAADAGSASNEFGVKATT